MTSRDGIILVAGCASLSSPTAWTREKEAWRRRGEPYPETPGPGQAIFRNAVHHLKDFSA